MIKFSMRRAAGALSLTLALTALGAAGMNARAATADTLPPARVQCAVQTAELRSTGELPPPPPDAGPHGPGPLGPLSPMIPGGPGFATARTVEAIAHLYRVGGHPEKVLPFYRETLTQARDPILRRHLREAIARETLQPAEPADTTAAIATLRAQLNEDLAASPTSDAQRR
ncbi:hypothetical protein [Pandoraea anhela]|uniref:Uncharacterized protein n=1 Tax=Pandoraea anhela TaxID=2508295 RepID=A0A5E4XFC8_9BURK|nr:hypothetical protein [Pandoraea anhela]VVE35026.1 hypothetical protein PAN31108_03834 [Pandoraea anhela]